MKTRSSLSENPRSARVSRESILKKINEGSAGKAETPADPSRVVAELSAKNLLSNYHAIRELVGDQEILPMVKANAYGHGAEWAARILRKAPGLAGFGVATLGEGREIREALEGESASIVVFAGATPWSEEKGTYCEKWKLTPVLTSFEDFEAFRRQGWTSRLAYHLKFNTGMNRLGIAYTRLGQVRKILTTLPSAELPAGIMSHLAIADDPEHRSSLSQQERFRAIRQELAGVLPVARFHLANSAGIWRQKKWGLEATTDLVRPGLSLYGLPPWADAPIRGLVPVMNLRAQIILIHELGPGETVGYGATYRVKEKMRVGVIAMGYADGLHRRLGAEGGPTKQGGILSCDGHAAPLVGRISMDQATVELPRGAKVGDWVEILGPSTDAWSMAKAAETIPYELFTSLSTLRTRVERRHV